MNVLRRCGTYTQWNKYYSALKKNKIMPFAATWMELENLMLRAVSQKEKQISYDTIYIQNLIYGTMNLSIEKKQTHGLGELICDNL